mgnify:CR=1 FL=1
MRPGDPTQFEIREASRSGDMAVQAERCRAYRPCCVGHRGFSQCRSGKFIAVTVTPGSGSAASHRRIDPVSVVAVDGFRLPDCSTLSVECV